MDNEPSGTEVPPIDVEELEAQASSWPQVIGVISLVYAIMGLLCQSGSALGGLASEWLMSLGGLDVKVPAAIKIFSGVSLILVWLLGILLLVGAVKLLRRRRSAVAVIKQWVVVRLVLLVIGTGVGVLVMPANLEFQRQIMEAQAENLRESGRSDLVQEFDEDKQWRQSMIMTGVMTAVVAAYPLFLGFYLSRAKIAEEVVDWD